MSISSHQQLAHKLAMTNPRTSQPAVGPVDYDRSQFQHQAYATGRALSAGAIASYMRTFAEHLPSRRPLTGIDLGSGTGRFTPALAETLGGPVYGVEPSDRMRAVAQAQSAHPQVHYLAGEGAQIPRPDASADFVLMFLSFHHMPDQAAAAAEIARVLKSGGRVILRSTFKERIPNHWWRGFFPRSQAIEEAMFLSTDETRALFEAAGFLTLGLVQREIPFEGEIAGEVAKLKLRAVSVFEHMTEDELAEGFAAIDAAFAAGAIERRPTFGDFMVFERRAA
jgi:ubiquinone/menaquinone biosynthesis C-methylase UbiE